MEIIFFSRSKYRSETFQFTKIRRLLYEYMCCKGMTLLMELRESQKGWYRQSRFVTNALDQGCSDLPPLPSVVRPVLKRWRSKSEGCRSPWLRPGGQICPIDTSSRGKRGERAPALLTKKTQNSRLVHVSFDFLPFEIACIGGSDC